MYHLSPLYYFQKRVYKTRCIVCSFQATAKVVLCEFHETFMTYYKTTTTTTTSTHRRATKLNRSKKQPKPTARHPLKNTFRPIVPHISQSHSGPPSIRANAHQQYIKVEKKQNGKNLSCGYFWASK